MPCLQCSVIANTSQAAHTKVDRKIPVKTTTGVFCKRFQRDANPTQVRTTVNLKVLNGNFSYSANLPRSTTTVNFTSAEWESLLFSKCFQVHYGKFYKCLIEILRMCDARMCGKHANKAPKIINAF
jgi:hypothetical protein